MVIIDIPDGSLVSLARPHVILGAAIVYDADHAIGLPIALDGLLGEGGIIHLANHESHEGHNEFLTRMGEAGFEEVRVEIRHVDEATQKDSTQYSPVRISSFVRKPRPG